MIATTTTCGYRIDLDANDRDQLIAALEYTLSTLRGDLDGGRILADLDADRLDHLADIIFLVGT